MLDGLADARGLVYRPEAFGLRAAREAVAADYGRRGVSVEAGRIVLTASTSEAYSLLFKLLCDPGTDILVPRPSYPLLDHLAHLDAVSTRFSISISTHVVDRLGVGRAGVVDRDARNRGRLAQQPHGSRICRHELERLDALAAEHGAAIIADEVFADYDLAGGGDTASPLRAGSSLVFSLGGLSKSIGLPQAKLAWIAAGGPPALVAEALARLEFAADAYLSVSTPVQEAAAELLRDGSVVREQIQARVAGNYRDLVKSVSDESGCTVLQADGGWYAVLRVPAIASEEDLVLSLLVHDGVLTHPGYFFDFQGGAHLVVSLLSPRAVFREGIARILRHFACTSNGA